MEGVARVLHRLPDGARVAVIRLRSLGDCVLTTPALDILKQSRPDLRVAVVVEDRFAPHTDIPRARLSAVKRARAAPYAVIHPIASLPGKTWPAERFLAVAAQLDIEPVFIAGPGEDLSVFRKYRTLAGAPLAEIKNLLANASLFLGNDSGPAHMAAAFGIPVVVIFGSSNVDVWRPWRTCSEVLSSADGIASVSTEQVVAAVARVR